MYLKSIELYGFKSFAHKMSFKFDTGITAIVGPNGSGKSNIADAVRWVLGEQSVKLLRGSKMQDVIFSGTEARKPLGYCQVDLTIDNHDMKMPIEYTEVTVSRRVYRSGEGEYYINGTECRLKDVHELFFDTGVGKEGYSIIGQGQIDLILSTKPEDRRALFDEAAGIVKYKRRKATAEKNLDEERQSLVRINDIIRELEKQRDSLKGQAEVAKEYLQLKEALKKYEVNIFIYETEKLYKNIEEIDDKEGTILNQIEDIKSETLALREAYGKINEALIHLDGEINELKTTETRLSVEKEKKESQIELIREQISHLEGNSLRLSKQNEELSVKLQEMNEERSRYGTTLQSLRDRLMLQEGILSKKQEEFESIQQKIAEDEKQISTIQSDMIERLNETSNVRSKIQRYQTMNEHLSERKSSLNQQEANLEAAKKAVADQASEGILQMELNESRQKQIALQKEEINKILIQSESRLAMRQSEIRDKSDLLHKTISKHKAIEELSEQYEGYSLSIKKIMELKKAKPTENEGVLGVVADILQTDKRYETALEIALGGNLQNIVTDHESTAKRLIEYLRRNQFGRATFLPLSSIQSKEASNKNLRNEPGFIGVASELVQYESKYRNIVEYLLGRVIVVENMDYAINLAKKHHYSLRIVTLLGELLQPGGSMTGGAYKNPGNQFLSRKRELEEYQKNIVSFGQELEALKKDEQVLISEMDQRRKELDRILQQEYENSISSNKEALELKQYENEIKKIDSELQEILVERSSLGKQEGQINESLIELEDSLRNNEVNHEQAEDTVQKLSEDILAQKELRDALNEELTKIRIEASSTKQQIDNDYANQSRIDRSIQDYNLQISQNAKEIVDEELQIDEKNQQIRLVNLEIETVSEDLKSIGKRIEGLQTDKLQSSEAQNNNLKLREEKNEQIGLLEKDILRLQNSKIKFEMQRDSNESYMWDEYELTYNMALKYKEEELGSVAGIRKIIADYKDQIKGLGDVNVNAIESYKTVSERYNFLTEQRDDLIQSEEKLVAVIEELNEQMVKQFKEKFKEITIKFNEVFQELFGGGKAMLQLTEDEDVLEAGIEINAQPPGKKLQNMRLLSGGEKAFTAISLLFAIQALKPSPFCVLDEIEAALDDANVYRFAKYLHKLTVNTQFIIITHRRGTMEAANTLYGITMQEKGVSTQVSVKLLESDLS